MPETPDALPQLYIIIGSPGAGKSTYATKLATDHPGAVRIEFDEIGKKYASENNIDFKKLRSTPEIKAIPDALCREKIRKAALENKIVIFDDVNLNPESRKKILEVVPASYRKIAILLEPQDIHHSIRATLDRDVNLIRAGKQPRLIPFRRVKYNFDKLVPPSLREGFDEVQCYNIKWNSGHYMMELQSAGLPTR